MNRRASRSAQALTLLLAAQFALGCGQPLQSRLFTAVWNGDTNQVASLLSAGAQVNGRSGMLMHETPLIDAVRFEHIGVVRVLLARGADPNLSDREGHGPLYHALTSPYLDSPGDAVPGEIVSLLLKNGAAILGRHVMRAINDLGANDPRYEICQKAVKAAGTPVK